MAQLTKEPPRVIRWMLGQTIVPRVLVHLALAGLLTHNSRLSLLRGTHLSSFSNLFLIQPKYRQLYRTKLLVLRRSYRDT